MNDLENNVLEMVTVAASVSTIEIANIEAAQATSFSAYCKKCGQGLADNEDVCSKCGTRARITNSWQQWVPFVGAVVFAVLAFVYWTKTEDYKWANADLQLKLIIAENEYETLVGQYAALATKSNRYMAIAQYQTDFIDRANGYHAQGNVFYVTATGDKYHFERCQYVSANNVVAVYTKAQAQEEKYTPCSVCQPGY